MCCVLLVGSARTTSATEGATRGATEGAGGWRPAVWGARPAEPLIAVAASSRAGLAFASGGVVRWWQAEAGGGSEAAALPDVRDVAFGPRDVLWIATGEGLFRWEGGARPERRSLRGDAGVANVHRVIGDEAGLLVATEAGAYWSTRGRIFQPLVASRVGGVVEHAAFLALGEAPGSTERRVIWLLGPNGLERVEGIASDSGLRILRRDRLPLPRPRSEARAVDLVAAASKASDASEASAASIAVLYPDGLAVADASARAPVWQRFRPVLAPGAVARRLDWNDEGLMLATDRGLYRADAPGGRFQRVGPEPGAQPCVDLDVSSAEGRGIALCRSGVHVRSTDPARIASAVLAPETGTSPPGSRDEASPIPEDPPVAALRARALVRAGLDPERDRALRSGLARRGWWPELGLQFGADFDRDDRRFADQAFVSGDYRRLSDRTRDRTTRFEALLQLDWRLGEVAYPDDSVDLSRELRQVLALRDDVSDEIHQLYFERARIRARLAAGGPFEPGEPAKLRLRARELAAGLDAWTGGWLSEWQRDQASLPPDPSSPNEGPENRGLALE